MVRTIISLPEEDHAWLIRLAKKENVSMAELIRNAIEQYRQTHPAKGESDYEKLVNSTKGIWKKGDGLSYQQQLRSGWDDR